MNDNQKSLLEATENRPIKEIVGVGRNISCCRVAHG